MQTGAQNGMWRDHSSAETEPKVLTAFLCAAMRQLQEGTIPQNHLSARLYLLKSPSPYVHATKLIILFLLVYWGKSLVVALRKE